MQRLIHKGNPYLQHDRNVANTPMSKELKDWASSPEEWHAEYNSVVNRLTGKAVPVSDLKHADRQVVEKFFQRNFHVDSKTAKDALEMLKAYQHDYLNGFNVNLREFR